ncbi:MAG TPA: molybdopterin-binding protein [Stenomitos sp.]
MTSNSIGTKMPRKDQGWITFQTSEEERQLLETICQQSQRTKTEVLREMLRGLKDEVVLPVDGKKAATTLASAPQNYSRAVGSRKSLKISSRNVLEGRVKHINKGSVNTEVILEIVHPVELTSIITTTSAEALGLTEGSTAYAAIKSNNVVIATE